MRNAFAKAITQLAESNERLCLLTGDIGNRLFDDFKEKHTERFFNCGIAEANMTSFAAGLALEGYRPVTYTIASFNSYRCYEQIKLDVCFQNLPVVIVGTGAGLSYASLNATHHAVEDIACMRVLPNMTVLAPADPLEVEVLLSQALSHQGPVYFRLGKKGENQLQGDSGQIKLGKAVRLREGRQIALLSTGCFSLHIMELAERLATQYSIGHYHFNTVKPLDREILASVFAHYDYVFTFEEHTLLGGFGSAISEWYMEYFMNGSSSIPAKTKYFKMFATKDEFMMQSTEKEFAFYINNLTIDQMEVVVGDYVCRERDYEMS